MYNYRAKITGTGIRSFKLWDISMGTKGLPEPINYITVMGKSKSWFDSHHDQITGDDLIWVQKIWYETVIWFEFDFILCDLIWWFEQITTFSNLGQGIMITLLVFLLQLS